MAEWIDDLNAGDRVVIEWGRGSPGSKTIARVDSVTKTIVVAGGYRFSKKTKAISPRRRMSSMRIEKYTVEAEEEVRFEERKSELKAKICRVYDLRNHMSDEQVEALDGAFANLGEEFWKEWEGWV